MGRLVRLIGSGIGLATEAMASKKSSSSSVPTLASSSRSPPPENGSPPEYAEVADDYAEVLIARGQAVPATGREKEAYAQEEGEDDSDEAIADDEEQWDLDDAQDSSRFANNEDNGPQLSETQIVDAFMRDHPPPAYSHTLRLGKLPCPVIIPQRRPRDKKRGFIRAYAPVLADCGIDQATFLDFLKSFHQSSKASPWLNVINIAAFGAGMAPSAIAMGVSIAVQFAVGTAMELQSRSRTNTFLDRMNNEFFRPRGLFCLVMTYKPESSSSHDRVDLNNAISSSLGPSSIKRNLRLSSGKTYGEMEMPEAAPLIFPALDQLAADTSEDGVKKQSKLKSSQKFVANYMDKRAQAKYASENPDSVLAATPAAGFASRYSDPNHPASSGSLIALVTGGAVNPNGWRQEKRARRTRRRENDGRAPKRGGLVKKMLQKDVLYLMIVNMPTDQELAGGRQMVANEGAGGY